MIFNAEKPYKLPLLSNVPKLQDQKIWESLVKARAQLGELNGCSDKMPNKRFLLSPAIMREAMASSEIENVQTTISEVLENQLFEEDERSKANKEVINYNDAIDWGFENLNLFSVSTRLITGINHELLPESERGYRKTQNKIENKATGKIIYTPPIARDIPGLMKDLEIFLNDKGAHLDPLIKSAVGHYQFEAIHPFLDGNGRTGRIMMVLHLVNQRILNYPTLFISGYLLNNRKAYYDLLLNITKNRDWKPFILFMLKGYEEQAVKTKILLFSFMAEVEKQKEEIKEKLPAIHATDLVDAIAASPVINPTGLAKRLGISYQTASKYLSALERVGIMTSKKIGKYHIFADSQLVKILHED